MELYLGLDVGSVTTKVAALDEESSLVASLYRRTQGRPVEAIQQILRDLLGQLPQVARVAGVATTGSARYLAGVVVGADLVKNEITCQAVGASHFVPGVQTIIEIGGQDSKVIVLRDGVAVDFAMNTVCAAGTGSFLDQQAMRLNMEINQFGPLALRSSSPVRIAGRCTVFAESDMIHKQQMGHPLRDIIRGLCEAMVRNYLNNVAKGKEILPPVVFQGGVAFNPGIVEAFHQALELEIIVPPHHEVMGAIGAALLAREHVQEERNPTVFKGFGLSDLKYEARSFECTACPNLCEIVQIRVNKRVVACWGARCDRWELATADSLARRAQAVPDCESC